MPKYSVTIPYIATVTVVLEADDQESAIDEALMVSQPGSHVGNGSGKLIGVRDSDSAELTIECGEGSAEGQIELQIGVDRIDG